MTLKVGVLGRSECRGLAYQSLAVAEHINPERVLLVEPTPNRWMTHREWYDRFDTTVVPWQTTSGRGEFLLDEKTVRRWLTGLDVAYMAETTYDSRLSRWATTAGCAVVVHANPELLAPAMRAAPGIVWWAATPWLLDRLPDGTRVVPMPVDVTQARPVEPSDGPVRFLHVGGHAAHLDRNGTRLLADAVRQLRAPCTLTVTGQDGRLPPYPTRNRNIQVKVVPNGVADRWDAYQGDVLVLPRKFGGLCLPTQEAMACGMAVAMTDISPNNIWPGPRFHHRGSSEKNMLGGMIPVYEPDPAGVRSMMEWLATHPDDVARHKADALAWAAANSWEALLPTWHAELEKAAGCR